MKIFSDKPYIKKNTFMGLQEMVQWLREILSISWGLSWVPNTLIEGLITTDNSSCK